MVRENHGGRPAGPAAAPSARPRLGENRFKKGSAYFQCLDEREPMACALRALFAQPMLQLGPGAEERDGRTARSRCSSAIGEIVPYHGIAGSHMVQRLSALNDTDLDPASAGATGRLDDCICTKHAGYAERIDCADGVKRPAAKLDTVLCLLPGERVSIVDDVCRRIAAQEVKRLELGNHRSNIFNGEAGLFADLVQTRRPARSREKLKNRSPHAVLFWLKGLVPFLGETRPRVIMREKGLSRSWPGHH
jgi:hypothetical protein